MNPAVRYAILIIEKGKPQKRPTLNINNLNLYVRPAVTIGVVAAVLSLEDFVNVTNKGDNEY